MMGNWGADGFGMTLMMLAWTIGVVAVAWLTIRGLEALLRRNRPTSPDDAESVLQRRFASGDIDRQEYEQRLGILRS